EDLVAHRRASDVHCDHLAVLTQEEDCVPPVPASDVEHGALRDERRPALDPSRRRRHSGAVFLSINFASSANCSFWIVRRSPHWPSLSKSTFSCNSMISSSAFRLTS